MQNYHHRALNQETPDKMVHKLTIIIMIGHVIRTIAETQRLRTCSTACEATSVRR